MGNFIDKTFTVIADIILKILPVSKKEKQAFAYYRAGMAAQENGRYSEALENYYESIVLDEDPVDRGYTLYNIALIYTYTARYSEAVEFYHQALELCPDLSSAFHNIALIYHREATQATLLSEDLYDEMAEELFDKAAEYFRQALEIAPDNYPEAKNWLKITGR